eukprot:g61784.t1
MFSVPISTTPDVRTPTGFPQSRPPRKKKKSTSYRVGSGMTSSDWSSGHSHPSSRTNGTHSSGSDHSTRRVGGSNGLGSGGNGISRSSRSSGATGTPRTGPSSATPASRSIQQSSWVVALAELRSRQVVGFCAMDRRGRDLILYQFSDNPSYTAVCTLLHKYDPMEILMADTAVDSALYKIIVKEFDFAQLELIKRRYFNETQGIQSIQNLGTRESVLGITLDASKFATLAAAACLIKYMEFRDEMNFALHSLRVEFRSLDGHLSIDHKSIKSLEVMKSLATLSKKEAQLLKGSLFECLNRCLTPSGSSLLRSNLLQPLNDLGTIEQRLNSVDELLSAGDLYFEIVVNLPKFPDLGSLVAALVKTPKKATVQTARASITNLLMVKRTVELLPSLSKPLLKLKSPLLRVIAENVSSSVASAVLTRITETVNDDSSITRKNPEHSRQQMAFAVKAGIDGMLDVARATFCETIKEINDLTQQLQTQLECPTLREHYTASRGFHLNVPAELLLTYPNLFVKQVKRGKRVYCTTEDLISLNDRQNEAFTEIVLMTDRVIAEVLTNIRQQLAWLSGVAESLAYLDMICCFVGIVSAKENWVRPRFTEEGPIAIKAGRHPVLEEALPMDSLVPNDIFLDQRSTMMIVTGPNASGKTTFLKTLAVLALIAHIGCFVPCKFASFRRLDRILTRLSSSSDIEENASSFYSEMRDCSYILQNGSAKSLVVIDEVGRGTSNMDGIGLAWSLCEELLRLQCLTVFATHYLELTELPYLYANVKNISMKVEPMEKRIDFTFEATEGVSLDKNSRYGIYIAELAGIPEPVIPDAHRISDALTQQDKAALAKAQAGPDEHGTRSYMDLLQSLDILKHATISLSGQIQYLIDLKANHFPNSWK